MNKLKLKYETLFNYKNKKVNFIPTVYLFKDELLDKCFFIYPIYFNPKYFLNEKKKHEVQVERYMEIVALCHYIFTNKKVELPKIKDGTLEEIDKICNIKTYTQNFYSYLYYHKLDTFKDIEFLSLVFLLTYLLHKKEYKNGDYFIAQTSEKNIKDRVFDIVKKLKYDISKFYKVFKPPKDMSAFGHFFDRFENGLPNIFKGTIPKKMNPVTTYKFIKKYDTELNIKEEDYIFEWETPFKYKKENEMIIDSPNIKYCGGENFEMLCINLKRNKLIIFQPANEELIFKNEFLRNKQKECKNVKSKWLALPIFVSRGLGNEMIYFNNIGIGRKKINLKLSPPPSDFVGALKVKIPFIWVVVDTKGNTLNYGINKN